MAVDKLVDSTQLDADLTSVADAIRTKGGTSAQLAFPAEFVSAINNISGGVSVAGIFKYTEPVGEVDLTGVTTIRSGVLNGNSHVTKIYAPNITGNIAEAALSNMKGLVEVDLGNSNPGTMYGSILSGCTSLKRFYAPKLTSVFSRYSWFKNCTALETIAFPSGTTIGTNGYKNFDGCTSLRAVDLGKVNQIYNQCFYNCSVTEIILRRTSVVTLRNVNVFELSPFASGGTGGTIYIPKSLYDQLGTGTNDYKAASNWSTIDGYGTITWAQIEGSIYETQYADGTPVAS